MTVRPPHHTHTCLVCRGNYPCWELRCTRGTQIVCDDCAEKEAEENEISKDTTKIC